jgi:tetratricopeptide (TPR) repeat protein
VAEAKALYRRIDRFYALVSHDLGRRARRGLRECQRYEEADALYRNGDAASAAAAYEALIATGPVVVLRDVARQRLLESSHEWASHLAQAGDYERALDRYRFILDEYRDRPAQQAIADLHLARGQALLAQGDYRGAIATYQRVAYDVYHPSLWALADDQAVEAYCAWSASLQAAGRDVPAAEVCAELGTQFSAPPADLCPACAP